MFWNIFRKNARKFAGPLVLRTSLLKGSRQRHKARTKHCEATRLTLSSPPHFSVSTSKKVKWRKFPPKTRDFGGKSSPRRRQCFIIIKLLQIKTKNLKQSERICRSIMSNIFFLCTIPGLNPRSTLGFPSDQDLQTLPYLRGNNLFVYYGMGNNRYHP